MKKNNRLRTLCVGLLVGCVLLPLTGCGEKQEKPKDPGYYDGPQKKLGESSAQKTGGGKTGGGE